MLSCKARVSALYLDAEANLWVGAGGGGSIQLWRKDTLTSTPPNPVGILRGHGGAVTGIVVDACGRLVSTSLSRANGIDAAWRSRAPVIIRGV